MFSATAQPSFPDQKRERLFTKIPILLNALKMRNSYKGISINTSKNTHETVFSLIKWGVNYTIVDIPSGSGAFVQRLKDAGCKHVIAADIDNILQIAHGDFVCADMTKPLPIADASCDVLVCIDGIEHIDEQHSFVREAHRILKTDGEIIISTPNISSLRSRWKWMITGHHYKCEVPLDENKPTPLHHIGMISFPELRYLLHTNGFRINAIRTNRIKAVAVVYSIFLPIVFLSTLLIYLRRGKKEGTLHINKSIFRQVFTKEVLFGETIIVKAIKIVQ
ncbi:MAG: class I SAM-dependent methyltransferase [Saprospiraceae bacterium]|nr:class I SAM-dependent methyltransferase [Saprospiraceae bacterium]